MPYNQLKNAKNQLPLPDNMWEQIEKRVQHTPSISPLTIKVFSLAALLILALISTYLIQSPRTHEIGGNWEYLTAGNYPDIEDDSFYAIYNPIYSEE